MKTHLNIMPHVSSPSWVPSTKFLTLLIQNVLIYLALLPLLYSRCPKLSLKSRIDLWAEKILKSFLLQNVYAAWLYVVELF